MYGEVLKYSRIESKSKTANDGVSEDADLFPRYTRAEVEPAL